MSPEELEQELRAIGAERYHDKHPFHNLLHGGKLNKGQVQAWALEPLLLSVRGAAQGRGVDEPLSRPRDPPRLGPPHSRP